MSKGHTPEPCECANCWLGYNAPIDLKCLRQREVQAMGAAISLRNWSDLERAYTELRDKLDNALHAITEAQKNKSAEAESHAPDGAA